MQADSTLRPTRARSADRARRNARLQPGDFVKFFVSAGEYVATLCAGLREAFGYIGGVPEHVLLDNTKAVVTERDAYGEGQHRWNPQLRELAGDCSFKPRLCRPYRAKTKGKGERFNADLTGSFVVPLAATLEASGLRLDVELANVLVRHWLDEVAHVRVHPTTTAVPAMRLAEERAVMLAAPALHAPVRILSRLALPIRSLRHPLSVYDALLEVM